MIHKWSSANDKNTKFQRQKSTDVDIQQSFLWEKFWRLRCVEQVLGKILLFSFSIRKKCTANWSPKNSRMIQEIQNNRPSRKTKVKQVHLEENLGKQGIHYHTKVVFEPLTKTVNSTSENLVKMPKAATAENDKTSKLLLELMMLQLTLKVSFDCCSIIFSVSSFFIKFIFCMFLKYTTVLPEKEILINS